ncbi:Uncharacterised protein [Mycobacterium tuberculosis]|nr:Uncharacterised protein [Mycobacterium tuberculosis]
MVERIQRSQVDLHIGFGVEYEPLDLPRILIDHGQCSPAEVFGIGEAQRRVIAIHHQPGHALGLRIVIDVVHAGNARHEPENAVMRMCDPTKQFEDGQGNRGEDSIEHS